VNQLFIKFSRYILILYCKWTELTYALNSLQPRLLFNECEIWSCHLGIGIGDEQMGVGDEFLRPVVIIKKFNNHLCSIVPLTKTIKYSKYYYIFEFIPGQSSAAILSQNRSIDAQRLNRMIGRIKRRDFNELKKRLMNILS